MISWTYSRVCFSERMYGRVSEETYSRGVFGKFAEETSISSYEGNSEESSR